MSKQLLIETRMNSLSLLEGVQSQNPNCLGTLYGPCADFKNATRNNNFYSRKLWENVFKDPIVKESLEDRVLIGELDHPGDRLETKATNACIVMTDYDFDDANGVVNGKFDILNTPNGKILRSLLDYGCKIGVSSRGEGDVTEDAQGRNVVEEDGSYYFVAFDAVVLPAVQKAKPALQESYKRENLKESLTSQVNTATTLAELELIKKVVETTKLPDVDSLLESIENKSKELEGVNDSSTLIEDLESSNQRISQLMEENKRLNREVANCKSRLSKAVSSQVKSVDNAGRKTKELESLNKNYARCAQNLRTMSDKVSSLESLIEELRSKNSHLEHQAQGRSIELENLRRDCRKYRTKISNLERSLEESQTTCQTHIKTINFLKESQNRDREDLARQLKESLTETKSLKKQLADSKKKLENLSKKSDELVREYASARAKELGVDSQRILESLNGQLTIEKANKVLNEEVSRVDRYRGLPVSGEGLSRIRSGQVSLGIPGVVSEESRQAIDFMETYRNMK